MEFLTRGYKFSLSLGASRKYSPHCRKCPLFWEFFRKFWEFSGYSLGILWEFFGYYLGILWEFFVDVWLGGSDLGIFGSFLGEFFGKFSGILSEFFGDVWLCEY